jgi:hypothetical protein
LNAGQYTVTLSEDDSEDTNKYYVSATGSDSNTGTLNAPVATINRVIALANAAGYSANQTVIAMLDGAVSWTDTTSGNETLTAHSFTLQLTGNPTA